MVQRHRANRRSTAAEKRAKCARFFGRGDDARQERDQFCPKWLVKTVSEGAR